MVYSVPLQPLPPQHSARVSLALDKVNYRLKLTSLSLRRRFNLSLIKSCVSSDSRTQWIYTWSLRKRKRQIKLHMLMMKLNCFMNEVFNTDCSAKENLHVRLSFDIPAQEKDFLMKRRVIVAEALQKLLGLKSPLSPEQVITSTCLEVMHKDTLLRVSILLLP